MAKKERNRRSARQARSAARAEREELLAASGAQDEQKGGLFSKSEAKEAKSARESKPVKRQGKPGIVQRAKNYLASVQSEMRRVVWPSSEELRNYTISTLAILVVAGVIVWLVDTGIVAALLAITGLRG